MDKIIVMLFSSDPQLRKLGMQLFKGVPRTYKDYYEICHADKPTTFNGPYNYPHHIVLECWSHIDKESAREALKQHVGERRHVCDPKIGKHKQLLVKGKIKPL